MHLTYMWFYVPEGRGWEERTFVLELMPIIVQLARNRPGQAGDGTVSGICKHAA